MFEIIDNVHGKIEVPSFLEEIISTPEFYRLRGLKQLGVANLVYSGAVHTRYEHCIGTAHLCNVLLRTLEKNSGIKINGIYKKCVILAGLLHDLGHGPFSHMWEHFVYTGDDKEWTHENSSADMVKRLFENNNIRLWGNQEGHDYCIDLITSLITGDTCRQSQLLQPNLMFLTEIVSNKFCNIDVDKIDYILRDTFHLMHCFSLEEFTQFLDGAKIISDPDNPEIYHIGYHCGDFKYVENLFQNRAKLHIEIYQNPMVLCTEKMFVDILVSAEKCGFLFKNTKLSIAHQNTDVFLEMDDNIVKFIALSDDPGLQEAKYLYERIRRNQFYQIIYESETHLDPNVLNEKFGDHFVCVKKEIPQPEIPTKIVFYDKDNNSLNIPSNKTLHYQRFFIISKSLDCLINNQAKKFLESYNNNF